MNNYNSMFHILRWVGNGSSGVGTGPSLLSELWNESINISSSGLNHGLVQRLRSSWEKVPHRHRRLMEVRSVTPYLSIHATSSLFPFLLIPVPIPILPYACSRSHSNLIFICIPVPIPIIAFYTCNSSLFPFCFIWFFIHCTCTVPLLPSHSAISLFPLPFYTTPIPHPGPGGVHEPIP